jgi:hypothetical protein
VYVDEAGSQHFATGVDDLIGVNVEISSNPADSPVIDRNVADKPGTARAVNNAGVPDQEIGVGGESGPSRQ